MMNNSAFQNVLTFVSLTALPLAVSTIVAEARGIGVGHQSQMQLLSAGRATNPQQMRSLLLDGGVDHCTTLNCGAVFINGKSQRNTSSGSIPFTTEIYAGANECLRLEVTYQSSLLHLRPADMKIVLVSPSGSVWMNDHVSESRPVVTAITDVEGHYTVQINQSTDLAPMNSVQDFGLAYGRYVVGTPVNCPKPAKANL